MTSILVVDDEISLQETLAYNLAKQGYSVETVGEGYAALDKARTLQPDLLILDIMLPGIDGIEICKTLRRENFSAPIIMLTARDSEIDRVVGLEIGADDYLSKPFSMHELIARVKAQLRRTQTIRDELKKLSVASASSETYAFGTLVINTVRREVYLDGAFLTMKPQEYELLVFFAEHRGQTLSREMILEHVWGWDFVGDSRTVDVHVSWLRTKIEADASRPSRIVTIRGGGYRFDG